MKKKILIILAVLIIIFFIIYRLTIKPESVKTTYLKDNNSYLQKAPRSAGHGCDYFNKNGYDFEEIIADYQAIGVSLAALTKNRDLAISLGGGYSVLAFTFSGLTFPTMAMFPILRFSSYLFPFTYYMTIMVEQALRGAAIEISLPNIGCMLLFLLLPMVIYKRL